MLNDFTGADKVYIACGYTDLRKGIDSLARLVHQQFELDQFTNCLSRENGRKLLKTLDFCRVLWYNVCMENREMQTSKTEEMVTISRAEYERFQEQAQASSMIYSLIETSKENGLDPYRYLLWVLRNAPQLSETNKAWAESLLPANAPEECYMPHK